MNFLKKWKFDLRLFDDTGDDQGADDQDTGGQDDSGGDDGGGADDKGAKKKGKKDDNTDSKNKGKTFTQDDVDSIVSDRLKRESKKTEALESQLKAIQKALGMETEETDPEKLSAQLQSTQAQLKSLKIEQKFYGVAKKVGADEFLTLAVLKANGKLDDLDPADTKLANKIESLVKAELDANPKLKATQARKTGDDQGDDQGTGKPSADMNNFIRRAAGKLK